MYVVFVMYVCHLFDVCFVFVMYVSYVCYVCVLCMCVCMNVVYVCALRMKCMLCTYVFNLCMYVSNYGRMLCVYVCKCVI